MRCSIAFVRTSRDVAMVLSFTVALRISMTRDGISNRNDGRSTQAENQKLICPLVGERRGFCVVMCAVVARKRVVLAGIGVERGIRYFGESRFDLSLCGLGDKFVFRALMPQ